MMSEYRFRVTDGYDMQIVVVSAESEEAAWVKAEEAAIAFCQGGRCPSPVETSPVG